MREAAAAFRDAVQFNPTNLKDHCELASVLDQLNEHQDAVASAREAVRLAPGDARTHNTLGLCLMNAKPKEAETALRQAVRLDAKLDSAHFNFAEAQAVGKVK